MSDPKEKNTMEVLLVEPGKKAEMATIGSDLKSMQQVVGGYIQEACFFRDPVVIVCNDEGKLNSLPLNRAVFDSKGEMMDIVAGTFFVCGIGEESFSSLPKAYQAKYEAMFKEPQDFLKLGKQIIAVPLKAEKPKVHNERKTPDAER